MKASKWTTARLALASALWQRPDLSAQQVADALNITRGALYTLAHKHRALFPDRRKRVTSRQIMQMIELSSQGKSNVQIAHRLGLCESTVRRYLGAS